MFDTIFFYLTQNRKIKIFLLWYVRTIIYVGLYFFDNPYERSIFQNVEAEGSSHTESIRLKYIFH